MNEIVCAPALVLSRQEYRETDRICVLYCEAYGKVPVRFIGVNRPHGKLKALSEPMVLGEYRLHMRRGAEFATVIGGSLASTFPGLRAQIGATLRGLEICELLEALTPPWQPNPEKFQLAVDGLRALERAADSPSAGAGASWISLAFMLRLMRSAGFGVSDRRVREESRTLWSLLHEADFDLLASLPADPEREDRLEDFLERALSRIIERPLRTASVRRALREGRANSAADPSPRAGLRHGPGRAHAVK